ncbi:MAG: U32 family peptidase [Clostridia bacterium]
MKKIELLSPAGDIDSFKAAIATGANAVYMGLNKFNARQMAKNFDLTSYIECIKYAHMCDVKVFLTMNTLMYSDEIEEALKLVLQLYSHGLDAVIVQDIGLAMAIHELIPVLPLHASTQMSVYNISQVKYLQSIGFSRVVLARELSVAQIREICTNTDMQIEVFIHGALCVSVSGQCLLSSSIGKRSANRGNCAQPCRMKYSLHNKENDELVKATYILSKKDIFGLEYISNLIASGVTSLKIEGRNKTSSYVAATTQIYRKYIDNNELRIDTTDKKQLLQLFNRGGSSSGYLDGVKFKDSITTTSPKNVGLYLGEVLDRKNMYIKVKLNEELDMHDGIEVYNINDTFSTIVTCIRDKNFKMLNQKVKKDSIVWIGDIENTIIGSKVYKTSSAKLNEHFKKMANTQKRYSCSVTINIKENQKISASVNERNIYVENEYIPQIAKKQCSNESIVKIAFEKTLDSQVLFNNIFVNIDNGLFVPVSVLNALRRAVVSKVEDSFDILHDIETINVKNVLKKLEGNKETNTQCINSLFVYKYLVNTNYALFYQKTYKKKLDRLYICVKDYMKYEKEIINKYSCCDVYLQLPNVSFNQLSDYISTNLEQFIIDGVKGFIVGAYSYMVQLKTLKQKYNIVLIADYTLNIINKISANFLKTQGFNSICLTNESNEYEQINNILPVEIVYDYLTVMTSRYCVIGSFLSNSSKCSMCVRKDYYLKDTFGQKYDIVCDNISCIMRLVKSIENEEKLNFSVRRVCLK